VDKSEEVDGFARVEFTGENTFDYFIKKTGVTQESASDPFLFEINLQALLGMIDILNFVAFSSFFKRSKKLSVAILCCFVFCDPPCMYFG
jgi:hypothetical protein